MLFEQIKKDQLQARKDKNTTATSALTCVIGDAQQMAKDPTNDQVVAVIRKHIKNMTETLNHGLALDAHTCISNEIKCLTKYLPAGFTDQAIGQIVANALILNDDINIGMIMGLVKKQAQIQGKMFDGAQVKRVFEIYK